MLFPCSFRLGARALDWSGVKRLQSDDALLKVERYAKVSQEIGAQYAALLKARGFVNRFKIEHCSVDLFEGVSANHDLRQQRRFYVFSNPRRAKDPHSILFDESLRLLKSRCFLRQDAHRGAGIDNEVERLCDSVNENFCA